MNKPIPFVSIHYDYKPNDIAPYHVILFHHKYGQIPMYMNEYWEWKFTPWWRKNKYIKQLKRRRDRGPLSFK